MIRRFELLGSVRVLGSNGAATMEVVGQFGGFCTTGEFFSVRTDSLDLHIRWRESTAAFAVEKPGHMDGRTTYSFQFFDRMGHAAFKVFLNFGDSLASERLHLFWQLREKFRATPVQRFGLCCCLSCNSDHESTTEGDWRCGKAC